MMPERANHVSQVRTFRCEGVARGLTLFLLAAGSLPGQIVFDESFTGTTASSWEFGSESGGFSPELTAASGADPVGDGWLRLTTDGGNQSNYARFDQDLSSVDNRITITFDYTAWGGSGADGLTWFLYDAEVDTDNGGTGFDPGAFGGSLGYANRTNVDGLSGGFLGVGIDEYGNYSNPTEGRNGGVGFRADEVALRGPGSGQTGYSYVAGTDNGTNPSVGIPLDFNARPETGTSTEGNFFRFKMELDETNTVRVFMDKDPLDTGVDFEQLFEADLTSSMLNAGLTERPESLRFGFSASTGGLTNYHEIRALSIFVSDPVTNAFFWDGEATRGGGNNDDNRWQITGSDANWVGDVNPTDHANVYFEDEIGNGSTTVRISNDNDRNRIIGSANFDNPDGYTIERGTLIMDTNDPERNPSINVTDLNGVSSTTHTIESDIQANADLLVNNSAVQAELLLSGDMNLQNNDATFAGQGSTTMAGDIQNGGQIIKNNAGTLTITGEATGTGFTQNGGETILNQSQNNANALEVSTIDLNGGTLILGKDNQISDTASLTLAGGTLATGGFDETLGTLTLTGDSSIDLGSGGSILNFSSSSGLAGAWDGTSILTLENWSGDRQGGGSDQVRFGSDSSGLTLAQLSQIQFVNPSGLEPGTYGATMLPSGEIVPVPEPATVIGGALLLLAGAFRERRRLLSRIAGNPKA